MSIYSIDELPDASAHYGFAFGTATPFTHEYNRSFRVETDRFDGAFEVASSLNFIATADGGPITLRTPYRIEVSGVVLEFDNFAFCDSIDPKRISLATNNTERSVWQVDVHYGPMNLAYNNEDPTQNAPIVRWSSVQFEEICDFDIDGNPIVNSAGLPFDPPITRDQSRAILTIEVNRTVFIPALAYYYKDKVNLDTFAGSDPGTVKLANISDDPLQSPIIGEYHKLVWEFHFNVDGWRKKVLDAGLMQIDEDSGTGYSQITLEDGSTPSQPLPLDGAGAPLSPPIDATNAVILEFEVYERILFSQFGFGSLFQ